MNVSVMIEIAAPTHRVWEELSDLGSHAEWMADARSVEFLTDRRTGVGTIIEVATSVGPLRTTDVIEVTEWVEGQAIGVAHRGLVTGRGRFRLAPVAGGTRLVWTEALSFPARYAGRAVGWLAAPVLRWVWRRNLARLAERVERSS